jgi:hypothetical protein
MAVTGQNSAEGNVPGSRPVSERDAGEVTREMSVGPLLARANLLRMRGQWDEAIAVCTEALRQAPKSPTAHSVLGDIYEAQGKYDDALQWYGMAVELAPDRTADREKLERVVAVQRGRLREIDKERAAGMDAHRAQMVGKLKPSVTAPTTGTGGRAAERTVEWFDRVFPPGRSESIARLIFALCGIISVLIASAAVFVYTSSNRTRNATTIIAEGGTNASGLPALTEPSPPITVIVPKAATPSSREPSAAKPPPASAAATPHAAATSAPTLLTQLTQSLPPGVTVTALHGEGNAVNPYQLEIALPKAESETTASTQERVLRGAALAARTLALLDNHTSQILIRASLRENVLAAGGSLPTRLPTDIPLFQGSVLAATIRNTDPAITPTAALQSQFTGVSWANISYPATDNPEKTPASSAVPPAAALAGPASP